MRLRWQWTALLSLSAACFVGCGGGDTAAPTTAQNGTPAASPDKGTAAVPPSASIGVDVPAPEEDLKIEKPEAGTPEATIYEMTQLWLKPVPDTDDIAKQRAARQERNEKIIELATEVIAKTHKSKEKEHLFNLAVHRMLEATLQLALSGHKESVDALYEHAKVFHGRDPKSKAAAEAGWFLAKFANENAQHYANQEPRWVNEFAKQARSFADRYSELDSQRSVMLLIDAAVTCDFYGQRNDAIQCYTAIRQKFADTPQAEQSVAPLRRLELVGNTVDLGGPTIDGGFTTVEEFKGSPVLVVFWSTQAQPFVEIAPDLIATTAKYESKGLAVIGVNLDTDESAIDAFAEKSGMGWRNIFQTDAAKRGWNNPIVTYYGVPTIPQLWLVNAEGTVVSTHVEPKQLEVELAKLMPAAKSVKKTAESKPEVKTKQ